jgi:hypothetical protein
MRLVSTELSHHQALFLNNIQSIFITENSYEMNDKLQKRITTGHLKIKNKIFVSFFGVARLQRRSLEIGGRQWCVRPGSQSPTVRKIDVLNG